MKQNWVDLLERGRNGDYKAMADAMAARQLDDPLSEYFYARYLVESSGFADNFQDSNGCDTATPPFDAEAISINRAETLEEAMTLLRHERYLQPKNMVIVHLLALALARSEVIEHQIEAARLWRASGLPYDLDLLLQTALTLELQMRPWPVWALDRKIPWPDSLPRVSDYDVACEETSFKVGLCLQKKSSPSIKTIRRIDRLLFELKPHQALLVANDCMDEGFENGEFHLLAGIAAEQAQSAERARAHLVRALQFEPMLLIARTWLGRVYWRTGWFDLAMALWRSLPVEGPNDYGRHYHLALAYATTGERMPALTSARIALHRFFYDTVHLYVRAIFERWCASKLQPLDQEDSLE